MRCWDLLVFVVLKTTVLETLRGVLFGGHASSLLGLLGIVPEESRIGQALRESSEVAVPAFLNVLFPCSICCAKVRTNFYSTPLKPASTAGSHPLYPSRFPDTFPMHGPACVFYRENPRYRRLPKPLSPACAR